MIPEKKRVKIKSETNDSMVHSLRSRSQEIILSKIYSKITTSPFSTSLNLGSLKLGI